MLLTSKNANIDMRKLGRPESLGFTVATEGRFLGCNFLFRRYQARFSNVQEHYRSRNL